MNETTNDMKIVLGGVTLGVLLRDGSKQEVKVRQLPVRLLVDKWLVSQGEEDKLTELYCDKEPGWDDTLLPESHAEIIQIGEKLNSPLFARWAEDRRAGIGGIKDVKEALETALMAMLALHSPSSSPPAASSSAALTPR